MSDRNKIITVKYQGVEVKADMLLWKPTRYKIGEVVLASIFGSENTVRAIFSAVASHKAINIVGGVELMRSISSLKYRSIKIGYGKRHAIVHSEAIGEDFFVVFPNESVEDAFMRFTAKKRIPVVREWVKPLLNKLVQEEEISPLESIGGISGYWWATSDDRVCDFLADISKGG